MASEPAPVFTHTASDALAGDARGIARDLTATSPPRGTVRRWVLRLLLFWSPVLTVAAGVELLLWRSGESWTIDHVIEAQQRDPSLRFLRRYVDQGLYRYKYLGLVKRRPRILALGSSRVMQFRAPMFGDDSAAFFNAGGMIQNLADLESFVRLVPDSLMPRVIILGVDMWWLNDNYVRPEGFSSGIHFDGATSWQNHLTAARELLLHPSALRAAIRAATNGGGQRGIALHAREYGDGFRSDGSLASRLAAPSTRSGWQFVDRERPTIPERIRRGGDRFEAASALSPTRLVRLRAVLMTLHRHGVLVLGFNPPVSSIAGTLLEIDDHHRELWREYRARVPALFEELALPFVNAATPGELGLDDRYLIDGFHAEETFHLYLLRRFAADALVARTLPTMRAAVDRAISSPNTNFWFADFPR